MTRIELIEVKVERKSPNFNLVDVILRAIETNGEEIHDGDILAISSKFVAMSENRVVNLSNVELTDRGKRLSHELGIDPQLAELVAQEADLVFSGVEGLALAVKDKVLTPNAGIDRTNVFPNHAILLPKHPFESAKFIRSAILKVANRSVGVVLTDSRLMPTRLGTTGVAIGVAGIQASKDERGRKDLFGNILRVTQRAIADDISSAAQLLMGEADEGVPLVIVRGTGIELSDQGVKRNRMSVDYKDCIYVKGLTDSNLIKRLEG